MRPPTPTRSLALVLSLALLTGCPDPTPTPDGDTADVEVSGETGPDAPDTFEVLPGACETAADCVATGPLPACRQLACVEGACTVADALDGAPCDDGDLCTSGSTCTAGACGGGGAMACDDGNECTNDACDPEGGCVHTFHQKPCDDGTVCTSGDHCFMGVCQGDVLDCDDHNACTDDVCDPLEGCRWTPRSGACTDGNACTQGDVCTDGACVPGSEVDCDDESPCTTDVCVPAVGCQYTILEGLCDDLDACTSADQCKAGQCLGQLVKCDDGNPCTSDYCDPASGCVFTPHKGACSDGDACTLNDACDAGVCVPGAPDPLCCDDDAGCDDADPCTTDVCQGGYCQFTGLDCDDGSACTLDGCVGGLCQHTPYGPQGGGVLLSEGFEAQGLPGWTLTSNNLDVKWQRDAKNAHAGGFSLYAGKVPNYTYDFGHTQASASREVVLPPGAATLTFWVIHQVAEGGCNYDRTELLVNGKVQSPQICESVATWKQHTYDLTAFAGTTVTLTLRFDTVDGVSNGAAGVWVDDLLIESEAPMGCCLTDGDCAGDGQGCLAPACHPDLFTCGVLPDEVACDDGDPCTVDACDVEGSCTHTQGDPGCCATDADCGAEGAPACAVGRCTEGSCEVDTSGCCTSGDDCPSDPARPCAVATCEGGLCGLDEASCCEVAGCDDGDPCSDDVCGDDGACTHAAGDPLCCDADADCATARACEVASCAEGLCALDDSGCCEDDAECPSAPEGECGTARCGEDGLCALDLSGC